MLGRLASVLTAKTKRSFLVTPSLFSGSPLGALIAASTHPDRLPFSLGDVKPSLRVRRWKKPPTDRLLTRAAQYRYRDQSLTSRACQEAVLRPNFSHLLTAEFSPRKTKPTGGSAADQAVRPTKHPNPHSLLRAV